MPNTEIDQLQREASFRSTKSVIFNLIMSVTMALPILGWTMAIWLTPKVFRGIFLYSKSRTRDALLSILFLFAYLFGTIQTLMQLKSDSMVSYIAIFAVLNFLFLTFITRSVGPLMPE